MQQMLTRLGSPAPARIASAMAACWVAAWVMLSFSMGMALSRSFSCILASAHAVESRLDPVSSAIARWKSVSIRR